ncbi:MAG: SEC-C metal-binding domain-containing protein [Anaerolineae bacterium]|nr:SEC-C metal-binding domain-containing protein [Anaerolineae bacterium]
MRSGQLQARQNLQLDFITQVEELFTSFLANHLDDDDRDAIWNRTRDGIEETFAGFPVSGQSAAALKGHQLRFRREVDDILSQLLLDSLAALEPGEIVEALQEHVTLQQDRWRQQIGEDEYHNFQRLLLLSAIDREWRDYLTAMDDLRREVGLEAIAQRDPKVEYKRRSYQMFADMRGNIDEIVVDRFFRELQQHQDFIRQQEAAVAYQEQMTQAGYQVVDRDRGKGAELRRDMPKVGRNDPCPCGSGKKYKHCHMRQDAKGASRRG